MVALGTLMMVAPPVTRSSPGLKTPSTAYRQDLRTDFCFSCAYCTISEEEAHGISFEIDHYQPQQHGGTHAYDNLLYACDTCNNQWKRGIWPNASMRAAG